jgi:hypothetical protein
VYLPRADDDPFWRTKSERNQFRRPTSSTDSPGLEGAPGAMQPALLKGRALFRDVEHGGSRKIVREGMVDDHCRAWARRVAHTGADCKKGHLDPRPQQARATLRVREMGGAGHLHEPGVRVQT